MLVLVFELLKERKFGIFDFAAVATSATDILLKMRLKSWNNIKRNFKMTNFPKLAGSLFLENKNLFNVSPGCRNFKLRRNCRF